MYLGCFLSVYGALGIAQFLPTPRNFWQQGFALEVLQGISSKEFLGENSIARVGRFLWNAIDMTDKRRKNTHANLKSFI